MSSIRTLPPVPPELKAVSPFLSRAEELAKQDPIISYWCAYYAAQVGISLKARSTASRDLLIALLGVLEQMKFDIGSNDAIDTESVSSAYVENFALKVFANADNEDRSSRATRATAKKFLAAANFLEVLKTFPKTDVSESNEEKIRYAKWKAADIAKAFREGRKPTPGPPGWAEEQEELKYLQQHQDEQQIPSPPKFIPADPSGSSLTTSTSPTHHISSSATFPSPPERRSDPGWSDANDGPPESWSTAATPGTEEPEVYTIGTSTPSTASYDNNSHNGSIQYKSKPRSGSGSSFNTVGSNKEGSFQVNPWTNQALDAKQTPSPPRTTFESASPDTDKRVHFTPSTAGSPPPLPPPPLSGASPPKEYIGPSSIYAPPQLPIPPSSTHVLPPPASPPRNYIYAPPPSQTSPTTQSGRYGNALAPTAEVELTPGLIAKAQKHCRFAISSLDYEDAEQARKELRAALALLGG
ncbi:hypothetical protein M413DRAFT_208471 [Hebeloma cylindrosporum]|uniref:Vta1/callose synthase N-terminal domain-containing protein n=1 Tax=Hebeloma cylindrosporum TaxID=76867 RepID=A0A0C3CG62_HEBCY|nr:hypothetical protein M413DRAFT_208471 [Hebeloma cylindrosporum h7]